MGFLFKNTGYTGALSIHVQLKFGMVYGFLEDPMIEIASFEWLSGVLGPVWRNGATAIALLGLFSLVILFHGLP